MRAETFHLPCEPTRSTLSLSLSTTLVPPTEPLLFIRTVSLARREIKTSTLLLGRHPSLGAVADLLVEAPLRVDVRHGAFQQRHRNGLHPRATRVGPRSLAHVCARWLSCRRAVRRKRIRGRLGVGNGQLTSTSGPSDYRAEGSNRLNVANMEIEGSIG